LDRRAKQKSDIEIKQSSSWGDEEEWNIDRPEVNMEGYDDPDDDSEKKTYSYSDEVNFRPTFSQFFRFSRQKIFLNLKQDQDTSLKKKEYDDVSDDQKQYEEVEEPNRKAEEYEQVEESKEDDEEGFGSPEPSGQFTSVFNCVKSALSQKSESFLRTRSVLVLYTEGNFTEISRV